MLEFRKVLGRKWPGVAGAAAIAAAMLFAPTAGVAQNWPTKPVTIVVPFNPGASNDNFGRGLAEAMSRELGQPVVVENRQGAAGFVGASHVSRAAPDGYTLLFTSNGVLSIGRSPKIEFDVFKQLTPIAMAAQAPTAFVVPASVPVGNVKEFIAWAKANEGKVFYGSTGVGTIQQIHAELFNLLAGTKLKGITYPSAAPGVTDLAAGRVHLIFATQSAAQPQIDAGRLKLFAYSGPYAPPSAPKAPTMAEAGLPDFEGSIWFGLYGPPGMPADLRDRINAVVGKAIKSESFKKLMDNSGSVAVAKNPADFEAYIRAEIAQLDKLVAAGAIEFK